FDEMSTVSPSIRPLTKRVPSEFALVRHALRLNKLIASSIDIDFIKRSSCLLMIGALGAPYCSRQVRTRQSECVQSADARVIGSGQPVLCIDYFGVIGHALQKSRARQFHFLAR